MIFSILKGMQSQNEWIKGQKQAPKKLYKAIGLRVVEALLLASVYFCLYPVLVRIYEGTITPAFIAVIATTMLSLYVLRSFAFHYSAGWIYESIFTLGGALRLKIADHLRKLPLGSFQRDKLAHVKSIITDDMQVVSQLSGSLLGFFVSGLCMPTFIAIGFLFIDWRLALAISASTLLALPILVFLNHFVAHYGKKHFHSISQTSSRLVEYVLGIKVLKSYGLTGDRFSQLKKSLNETRDTVLFLELGAIALIVVAFIFIELGFPIVLFVGTSMLLGNGIITPPELIFALIMAVRLYVPVQEALTLSTEFQYLNKALERIQEIFRISAFNEPQTDKALTKFDIEFDDVSFAYDSEETALKKVSFSVQEGKTTALVGPSGAGKTTVANLIARFWDASEGEIRIGGTDIKELNSQTLMSYVSFVFQDVILFNDTIFENIRMAKPEATDEEVYDAAQKANCHKFITGFDDGYQTMVGEGGARLSGGEKQRVSIARALLKNAPILLLDEATASVDPSSEIDIQKAFKELAKDKTVIVIAHKLATIKHADQIIVLDHGEVVEQGTHGDLVKKDGLYAELWSKQNIATQWQVNKRVDDQEHYRYASE